jgi:hypothetical protein
MMGERPLARSTDLIVEELGDEVLVYDTNADRAHSLSPDAAKVWRACDGGASAEELSAKLGLDADTVARALDELRGCDLLEESPTLAPVNEGSTRREATVKMAKVGAAVVAAPLIVSVAAPTAQAAVTVAFCAQFSSGNCGASSGCSSEVGCCCCVPPLTGGNFPPGEPCDLNETGQQCKTCVPTDQQATLCPQFGHGPGTSCSATG